MCDAHVHGAVDLGDGLVVGGELIDLDAVAHQLAHDLDLKLVQLALRDGVRLRDDWDYVHLFEKTRNIQDIGCKAAAV